MTATAAIQVAIYETIADQLAGRTPRQSFILKP
jgi:hypothetical protein